MIDMNHKYQTRDGRAVRILCVDGPNPDYPIIGVIKGQTGVIAWLPTGRFCGGEDYPCDLIPVPTKHEGWCVVNRHGRILCARDSEDEAYINANIFAGDKVVHFFWED